MYPRMRGSTSRTSYEPGAIGSCHRPPPLKVLPGAFVANMTKPYTPALGTECAMMWMRYALSPANRLVKLGAASLPAPRKICASAAVGTRVGPGAPPTCLLRAEYVLRQETLLPAEFRWWQYSRRPPGSRSTNQTLLLAMPPAPAPACVI